MNSWKDVYDQAFAFECSQWLKYVTVLRKAFLENINSIHVIDPDNAGCWINYK